MKREDGEEGAALLVRSAGLNWRFEADGTRAAGGLAAWLGPRARPVVRGSTGPPVAGVIRQTEADGSAAWMSGIHRRPGGLVVRAGGYEILFAEPGGTWRADVRCRDGSATLAARLAFRVMLVRSAFARGGLALHAASVRAGRGVFLFIGRRGAGKSTAARAFPKRAQLDDDLAVLSYDEKSRLWVRLSHIESRLEPTGAEQLPIRAVLLPESAESAEAADAFRLTPLRGREAFVGCLQLPFFAPLPDELRSIMARLEKLCADIPVARLAWKRGENLPALLDEAL